MSERGGFLPRELPERPEMTRSTGHRVTASLREMVLGTFAETKVPRRAGARPRIKSLLSQSDAKLVNSSHARPPEYGSGSLLILLSELIVMAVRERKPIPEVAQTDVEAT